MINQKNTKGNFYFSSRDISTILVDQFKNMNKKTRKQYRVLDVGCGDGVMIADLQQNGLLTKNIKLSAVDLLKVNIYTAKNRKLKASFKIGDAQKLPYKNNSFDFIYSWMVIEHVSDPNKMMQEIKRVLKPDGKCFISSVMKHKYAVYFYRNNHKFVIDPTHLHEYSSLQEFKNQFTRMNFKILKKNSEEAKYPAIELILKIFIRLNLLKPTINLRDIFLKNVILRKARELFILPIPGFYHIEALVTPK